MHEKGTRDWRTPEFILVVVMLITLVLLVWGVLLIPLAVPEGDTTTKFTDVLDYRKSILAVIVTAFSAWVGAGAAYFFGRENLKEAAASLLAMREPSAKDRLRQTPVRDIPPRLLGWTVKKQDDLKSIMAALDTHPEYWFITVVKGDGSLATVLEEEAFWRFVNARLTSEEFKEKKAEVAYEAILGLTVQDVLGETGLRRFWDCYVPARLDSSAGDVYASMQDEGLVLAVVSDDGGKPTHFFTTADVRRVLLRDS
ncbi:MAG TPA: hypothetical protein VMW58_14630 [Anaerolineae bacterium]|nr:hypothetical protein [Anaerolineae bacterium]